MATNAQKMVLSTDGRSWLELLYPEITKLLAILQIFDIMGTANVDRTLATFAPVPVRVKLPAVGRQSAILVVDRIILILTRGRHTLAIQPVGRIALPQRAHRLAARLATRSSRCLRRRTRTCIRRA